MFKYGPYSPSRMETAACPARFHAEYIAETRAKGSSTESKRGNVVHEVFEEITKGYMRQAPLTWQQVEEKLSEKIQKYALTDMGEIDFSIRACRAYMENAPQDLESVIGTEEHIAIRMGDSGKWVEGEWDNCDFRGKIDILKIRGNTATFIDHKTQPFVETADTFQMGFYAWLISVLYPQIEVVESILHFASPEINYYSKPFSWNKEMLANIESQSRIMAMSIEKLKDYPAVPNYQCKYCPILLTCQVAEDFYNRRTSFGKLKNAPVRSGQEAVELAETINVLDEGRHILNGRLQKFAKEIGPVLIQGKEYGYETFESVEPKSEASKWIILDVIKSTGLDPMKYFKLDATVLKTIWRHLTNEDIQKIKDQLTTVKNSRFGGRKL